MKFSIRFADQIVGLLILGALAIIVVVVFMLGTSQRWFTRDYQYKTYFSSASGISLNMPVQYKGFTIGHVRKIRLTDDDEVEVIFTIFEEHNHRVTHGSIVEAQASPIGLGNTFMFHPGKGKDVLDEGSIIPARNSEAARKLIREGDANALESSDKISQIINNVEGILKTVNDAVSGREGTEEKTLEQILVNVEKATGNINEVARVLSVQLGPVLKNIESFSNTEGPVLKELAETLKSISGILKSLDKTIEFVPTQLPQIAILLSQLNDALTKADQLMVSLLNNPLLRGGVPEVKETGPGAATPRDLEF